MIGVRLFVAVALLAITAARSPASAQDYPNKPIKLIVPTAPAGIGDIIARQMQQKLSEAGVTIVVENRPGAAGVIGDQRSRQGAGRRLHVPGRQPRRAVDAAASAENSVRSGQELHAGLPRGHGAEHSGGAPVGAGQGREGADRLRQGQSGQAHLRLAGRRRVGPHRRGAVQAERRRRHHARAVQGRGAGGAGPGRRSCQHDVRRGVAGARTDPRRAGAAARAWRPTSASACCRTCRP